MFRPCFVIQYFMFFLSCNHVDGKKKPVALLLLSSWCLLTVSVM